MESRTSAIGGTSLILAAISVFAAINIRSDHSQERMAAQFADVEASRTPEVVAAALFVLGATLFVPAGLGIFRMAQGRGATLTMTGGLLTVLGGMWFATGRAMTAHLLYSATGSDIPRDQMLPAFEHITGSASFSIFLPFLLCFMTAPVVLGLGLWKMGIAPAWIAPGWIVSLASFLATEGSDVGEFVGFGLMTVVLTCIGVYVIRGSATRRSSANQESPSLVVETEPAAL